MAMGECSAYTGNSNVKSATWPIRVGVQLALTDGDFRPDDRK